MMKLIVLGQIRHLLTACATVLVTKGYLEASMVEAAVGIAVYAIGAGWSAVEKRKV